MLEHLPAVLILTDRLQATVDGRDLVDVLSTLGPLSGDVAVVFREKDLAPLERAALAGRVADALADAGIPMLVASDLGLALDIGADGVHLAARDTEPERSRDRDADPGITVGRSCHDEVELAAAVDRGVDYVTLSPVFASPSKPGHGPALELGRFGPMAVAAGTPVYALGGIGPGRATACVLAGAHGVAVMGAVMTAAEPATTAAALVEEVHHGWIERKVRARP